jgi:hypothetical protein
VQKSISIIEDQTITEDITLKKHSAILVSSPKNEEQVSTTRITVNVGLSLPLEDFASNSSTAAGLAMTGYTGALEISSRANPAISWTSTFSVVINSLDVDEMQKQAGSSFTVSGGSYTALWGLTGIKFSAPASPTAELYGQAQGGLLHSSFPDIDITFLGTKIQQTATSKITFGFGVGAGVQMKNLNIGIRYYSAKPEYEQSASGGGASAKNTVKLPMNVLLLMIGITI